jgi:prolyl oligopeptidase
MKTILIFLTFICFVATTQAQLKYPDTKKNDVKDNYHGKEIVDPYRWLEDDNADDTKAWV